MVRRSKYSILAAQGVFYCYSAVTLSKENAIGCHAMGLVSYSSIVLLKAFCCTGWHQSTMLMPVDTRCGAEWCCVREAELQL